MHSYSLEGPAAAPPVLSSNPGAAAKLFLDFDGDFQSSWGSYSNITTPAYDTNGDSFTFSSGEIASIQEIWARVAEDYASFNIDVTTVAPGSLTNKVVAHVAVGGNGSWYGSAGGVAYIGGFYNSAPNVAYVFEDNLGNGFAKYVADASSHEAGHLFGLQHQSLWSGTTKSQEYYSGNSAWAPLMGSSYSATRSTWHNGTSSINSTSFQDDIAVIASSNNDFGQKADDFADTIATASQLPVNGGSVNFAGLLGYHTDTDIWKFTTGGGSVSFSLNAAALGPNLDSILELRNSSDSLLATSDPGGSLNASISTTLGSGTFYVLARSNATYGNMGQYTLSGTLPANQAPTVDLIDTVTSLAENTSTATDVRVAGLAVTDSDAGTNNLSLSGADAASFAIVGNALYLRAGTNLNFESKANFDSPSKLMTPRSAALQTTAIP